MGLVQHLRWCCLIPRLPQSLRALYQGPLGILELPLLRRILPQDSPLVAELSLPARVLPQAL